MKKQNENTSKLLQLIADNPDLEVLPLVNDDATSPDYSYTVAKWSEAFVDEYYVIEESERIYLRELDWDELLDNEVQDIVGDYPLPLTTKDEKEIDELAAARVEKYNWEKAIFVWIEPA